MTTVLDATQPKRLKRTRLADSDTDSEDALQEPSIERPQKKRRGIPDISQIWVDHPLKNEQENPYPDDGLVFEELTSQHDSQSHRKLPPLRYMQADGQESEEKTDTPADVEHPTWTRAQGDIWIRVERERSPNHYVLFKLEQSTLTKWMEPFYDMFGEDAGLEFLGDGTRGGLPVINVVGETAEDWSMMCRVIYDPAEFADDAHFYVDLVRLLELSRKYSCPILREASISSFSRMWPTSLNGFKRRLDNSLLIFGWPSRMRARALLQVALEYEIVEFLPVIRLDLCCLPVARLILGFPDERDGKLIIPEVELDRLLRGQERLRELRRRTTLRHLVITNRVVRDETCRHEMYGYSCREWLATLADHFDQHSVDFYERPERALAILDHSLMRHMRQFLCDDCSSSLKMGMCEGQRAAWMGLPRVFGMGSWFDIELKRRKTFERLFGWWIKREAEVVENEGEQVKKRQVRYLRSILQTPSPWGNI